MRYINVFTFVFFSLFIAQLHADITQGWDDPFNATIAKFLKGTKQSRALDQHAFNKMAQEMLDVLKENENDWKDVVDRELSKPLDTEAADYDPTMEAKNKLEALKRQSVFATKSYIAKVFRTKPGTLVFAMKNYPSVIVKIDNRHPGNFDARNRSYYSAYEKTQSVQKRSLLERVRRKTKFADLFLPLEYGHQENNGVSFVFSEKIPLFSEAEIDNMALMILLHQQASSDKKLKENLTSLFSDMIDYICQVDFNDINYRNVPFTVDGRLSPFDTDSFLAASGVFNFLSSFYGYKIFPTYKDVKPIVKDSCERMPPDSSALNPYRDVAAEALRFSENEKALAEIIQFLSTKNFRRSTEIPSNMKLANAVGQGQKNHAAVIDAILAKKLDTTKNDMLLGKRCEHIRDLMTEAGAQIQRVDSNVKDDNVDAVVGAILETGKNMGILHSFGTEAVVDQQSKLDIRGFVCF